MGFLFFSYVLYAVAGDTGVMGGEMSREFQVPSDIGEDVVRICSKYVYPCV